MDVGGTYSPYHDLEKELALSVKKKVPIGQFLRDVRLGAPDHQLMARYSLSTRELTDAFRLLLEGELLDATEFEAWSIFGNETVSLSMVRLHRRHSLRFPLPVIRSDDPESRGRVLNVSKCGLGTRGIQATAGEETELVIVSYHHLEGRIIGIQARCRWAREDRVTESVIAGFYVIAVSRGRWEEFQNLVKKLNGFEALELELAQAGANPRIRLLPGASADL